MALRLARKNTTGLIITDIALPGRSGLHFIGNVRKDAAVGSTPILVISGCGPMILVEAESAGADCCLEKPIQIDRFWTAIDELLRRSDSPPLARGDEVRGDGRRSLVGEVDRLVDELRNCGTDDKDALIRSLKENILRLQARRG